jgi:small ligand-binding sensory domain FIST
MQQQSSAIKRHHADDGSTPIFATSAMVATSSPALAIDLVEAELLGQDAPTRPPDILIAFINDHWQKQYTGLLTELLQRTGATTLVGGSGSGVLADRHEAEGVPALSCMALWLNGASATPIRLDQDSLAALNNPETWHAGTGRSPESVRGILLFADPYRMDSTALSDGLHRCYPDVPIVGGMMSASEHRRNTWIFVNDQVFEDGGAALVLEGAITVVPMVSHGTEPVGEPWTVTAVDRSTILTISDRPALEVLLDTAELLLGAKQPEEKLFGDWMIGFAANEYQDEFGRGDFLVRGMIGGDQERKGVIIGGMPRVGQTVQFQRRDPSLAGVDLRQHLLDLRAQLAGITPGAGLLFTCNGRGEALFGKPHHDSEAVGALFRDVPIAGLFCNGEIGPAGPLGEPALHGFSATLVMLLPDRR